MGILKTFFTNCAHPKGRMGRVMLRFMNFGHAPLTNWGLSLMKFQDGWTMLDIGCGGGATLQRLLKRSENAKVYGIDISEESVAKARQVNADVLDKQAFIQQGNVEKLPYEDNTFDLITAVETVYFWQDLPHCLQEVHRVLKPDCQFAIMLEVIETNSKWANVVDGMTVYSPDQIKQMLEKSGFKEVTLHRKKPTYATIIGKK